MTALREASGRRALTALGPLAVLVVAAGALPLSPGLAAAALLGLLGALLALRRPQTALLVAVGIAVLVPFYDGRYLVGSVGLSPAAACGLVLVPAAIAAASGVRLHGLDVAVGALVLLRCMSALVNAEGPLGATVNVLLTTALPYVVFRCLTLDADVPRRLAVVVVTTAVPLAALGVYERNGGPNPLFTLVRPELEAAQWARPELRSGGIRAEATFGHPIALGMFLALALLLAVVLAVTVHSVLVRLALLASGAALLLGLTATLSRGPLLVAGVGVVGWLMVNLRRVDVLRVGAALVAVVVVAVGTPVLGTLEGLQRSSTGATAEARSAEYRLQVLQVALEPEQFSLLGLPAQGAPVTEAVVRRTGLKSIDSELAVVHLTSGALALGAFLLVGVLVLGTALRRRLPVVESAWAVGMAAAFLNLTTVALLTQYEELFWGFTALVAGIAQRRRSAG